MFYDLPEQVFILNYDVWMRFRENRSDFGTAADPHYRLCVALQFEALQEGGNAESPYFGVFKFFSEHFK